jgi:hypothetical protein
MFSKKLISISAIAVNLWAWAPAASSGSLSQVEGRAAYQLIQNISYEFGSKSMSGYFLLVHRWYDEKCCHDKDCHPVPCEEIEKISDGWLWRDMATKQRHWFPHDRLKASHDDACHVCVSPMTRPSGICLYLPLPA